MTKEEAIEVLLKVRPCIIDNAQEDALDLAIEALSIEHASGSSGIPNDLEEAARKYQEGVPVDTTIHYCGADEDVYFANRIVDAFITGAKWQKEQYHFFNKAWAENMQAELDRNYENGKQAMKEQMMKEAVDTVVSLDAGGFPFIEFGVGKFGLKARDKVRVIVLKVEEE